MKYKKFPSTQTHLDFHTSPDILGIGSKFSKENFQKALKIGNLESITIFAKCHHGLCYYPTKVGTMHPNLMFDFTGAMLEAAHEIGVRAPIYITAGWSDLDAVGHPEWREVTKQGKYHVCSSFDPLASPDSPRGFGSWQMLCLNDGEYAKHIYELTEEICKRYLVVDGLFYDICVMTDACYCETCKKGMIESGLNPLVEEDARHYFIIKRQTFMQKCSDILKKYHPNATIFFNSGGADQYKPQYHMYQSHFEMEDLPTAWGGYDKLPIRAKYFSNTGKNYIGMTGKFHLDWGEFGGFKSKEALKFEVASMALYGAGCSIGDHMHPDGEMELQTYENIGYAYQYLKQIAPFCYGGKSTANIGVYLSLDPAENEGISLILLENQLDFDVILHNNFEQFDIVIIPSKVVLEEEALALLNSYIEKGGKLIFMADALVKDGKFQIDCGLEYIGMSEYDCDYLISCEKQENLPNAPMLCYIPGHRTKNIDAQIKAEFITPYFNRTYAHFCGHKNTPYNKNSLHFPAIAKKNNIVYLSHSLPKLYHTFGSIFHKYYFIFALKNIYQGGMVTVEGLGSQGRCRMIYQEEEKRYCLNIVYGTPIKKGCAEIIEDIMPIYNIKVTVSIKQPIQKVYLGVTGEELVFQSFDDRIEFIVPKIQCHTSIIIQE